MELRIVTFNCWGAPLIARDRAARMAAIGEALARLGVDVAGLQELFDEEDRQQVIAGAAAGGLVHTHYVSSGAFGSGLLLLSRFPIEETTFWRFRLNGRPQELIRGDYYAGKGVVRARLRTPLGPLDLYNTHLIAAYGEIGSDIYAGHRVAQAYEVAHAANTLSPGVPVILTGDLNTTPDRLPYRACLGLAGLRDSFAEANPGDPGITVTTDIPYVLVHEPERIDYVLYRDGPDRALRVLSSEVAFKTAPAGAEYRAYSDHYGVLTVFDLRERQAGPLLPEIDTEAIAPVREALERGLQETGSGQRGAWLRAGVAGLVSLLLVVSRGRKPISRRRFLRILAAVLAAVVLLAGGVTLSLGFSLSAEARAYRAILEELRSYGGATTM